MQLLTSFFRRMIDVEALLGVCARVPAVARLVGRVTGRSALIESLISDRLPPRWVVPVDSQRLDFWQASLEGEPS